MVNISLKIMKASKARHRRALSHKLHITLTGISQTCLKLSCNHKRVILGKNAAAERIEELRGTGGRHARNGATV